MLIVHVHIWVDIVHSLFDGNIIPWLSIVHDYIMFMFMLVVHVCIGDDVVFGLGDDNIIPRLSCVGCVYNSFVRE